MKQREYSIFICSKCKIQHSGAEEWDVCPLDGGELKKIIVVEKKTRLLEEKD